MPNRILRPGILDSEMVDQLDPQEEVFYRRLMSVVDDYGRYDARPSMVKAALFPLRLNSIREADISRWIAKCVKAGLIVLYQVESKPYLVLLNLGEPRAIKGRFPPPPEGLCEHAHARARRCTHASADVPPTPTPTPTPTSSTGVDGVPADPPGDPPSEDTSDEVIYKAYPRHVGKADALTAIGKARKRLASRDEPDPGGFLLQRVREYADARKFVCDRDPTAEPYTPHPATWFNQGRYDDDPSEWRKVRNGTTEKKPRPAPLTEAVSFDYSPPPKGAKKP